MEMYQLQYQSQIFNLYAFLVFGGWVAGGGEARMISDSILEQFDLEFCHLKNARVLKDHA